MDTEQARMKELEAENAALKKRLEVSDEHGWDGIACRDETIRVAKKQLLAAQHRIKMLREALEDFYENYDKDCACWERALKALATPDSTSEIDALVRDAARLAEIKHTKETTLIISYFGNGCVNKTWGDVLSAIDAAMKETP